MLFRSVVSANVRINPRALVEGSVLLPGVRVGEDVVVRNAIIDKNVVFEDGAQVGVDPELDAKRFSVSDNGIVVVRKNEHVSA